MNYNVNSLCEIPLIGGILGKKDEYQNPTIFFVNITWAKLTYVLNL